MKQWADDPDRPWTKLEFDQFGLHTTLEVKTIQALYYKAGKDRLLTIVLTRDVEGKRPDQMFYCTKLDWTAREILSAYACRWAIECTFENCKQFLGLEDPANRLPKAVVRTAPMALFIYTLVVIWFHQTGHQLGSSVFKCKTSRIGPSGPWPSGGCARSSSRLLATPDSSPGSIGPTDSSLTSVHRYAW